MQGGSCMRACVLRCATVRFAFGLANQNCMMAVAPAAVGRGARMANQGRDCPAMSECAHDLKGYVAFQLMASCRDRGTLGHKRVERSRRASREHSFPSSLGSLSQSTRHKASR